MHIEQRMAQGWISALCLGLLLGVAILPLQAGGRAGQFASPKNPPFGGVPPAFIDRGTPISERPFAQPFIDRSSPISERPLAPIGGGPAVAPGPVPLIWCHGVWVSADRAGQSCTSR
jgi:hypothetical protein